MTAAIRIGNLVVEPDQYRAEVHGHSLGLTHTQLRLLNLLASEPRKVWTREELLSALKLRKSASSNLAVHVSRLRKKLARCESLAVSTLRKRGYALVETGYSPSL